MSYEYSNISQDEEKAAELRYWQSLYNQAVCFFIQSMEKYIKSDIYRKINVTNGRSGMKQENRQSNVPGIIML